MIVDSLTELTIVGVFDRGIANQERIVMQANELINAGQYGVMLGIKGADGFAFPIKDNMYWFGDGVISKGDWVFLYTGPGETKTSELPNTKEKLYTIHWGRDTTVLTDENITPILFRIDAVQVAQSLNSLPQKNT